MPEPPALPEPAVLAATALLLALTVLAALYAVVASVRAAARDRSRAAAHARWQPALLDALSGDAAPGAVAALVAPGERLAFLQFLSGFAHVLGGASRTVLAEAAAPALPVAETLARAGSAERRALGVHLLGLFGQTAAHRARLVGALRDPAPPVVIEAARALARTADPTVAASVLDAVGGLDAWGASAAASTLALFGFDGGDSLTAALADARRPEPARVAAAEALRRLGYVPAAAAAARVAVNSLAPREVRAAALRLLRETGAPEHAPAVRPLLAEADEVLRLHAVSALAALAEGDEDTARLTAALDDPSEWVALRAARGLREARQQQALHTAALGSHPRASLARTALSE